MNLILGNPSFENNDHVVPALFLLSKISVLISSTISFIKSVSPPVLRALIGESILRGKNVCVGSQKYLRHKNMLFKI